jgi:glycine oxidase
MHGVELLEQSPVVELLGSGGRAQGVRIGAATAQAQIASQIIAADRICISSGAWSVHLLQSLGIETGILPVRGQMVLYRLEEPLFRFVLNEGHRYLVPREDGHLLAGSCEEEVGFDATTTESMIAELRAWAEGLLPELARATIERTWAGLRPGSFDSFPYLGAVPSWENVYIASGHFRHGLHWSTATAVLMQALMSGQPTEIDLEPFRVQRGHAVGRPYIHRA